MIENKFTIHSLLEEVKNKGYHSIYISGITDFYNYIFRPYLGIKVMCYLKDNDLAVFDWTMGEVQGLIEINLTQDYLRLEINYPDPFTHNEVFAFSNELAPKYLLAVLQLVHQRFKLSEGNND